MSARATRLLSGTDIEALALQLPVSIHSVASPHLRNSPTMEGVLVGQEVQTGLFATGYDVRFLEDIALDETVEPSLMCAMPIAGHVSPMDVDGFGTIAFESGAPVLICFGKAGRCKSVCRAGQYSAVGGFSLRQEFLVRLAESTGGRELRSLARLFEDDFVAIRFTASSELRLAATRMLDTRYGGTLARLHLESCALAFVAEAARLIGTLDDRVPGISKRHYDQAVRAKELLDQDIAQPPSIDTLTRLVGVNATTLRANFLKVFGTTIFGHVRNRRLEVAQFLLRTHDLSIAEVAYRVGFTNAGAFSSAYRKQYGRSPREETSGHRH